LAHHWKGDLSDQEFDALRNASTQLWFGHMEKYRDFPKLMIGRFVTELNELMDHHVEGPKTAKPGISSKEPEYTLHLQHMKNLQAHYPPKLALYSGHDTTIAPLLGALGVWDKKWPVFGSYVRAFLMRCSKPT
jgi:hypothetical protein